MGAPFVWFDLTAGDGGRVGEFYQGLFGWQVGPAAGDYTGWFTDGGQPWAGIVPADVAAGPVPAGRWVPYVVVDDLDAARKQAVALGGRVVREAARGPAGTSVLVVDPRRRAGGAVRAGRLIATTPRAAGRAARPAPRNRCLTD